MNEIININDVKTAQQETTDNIADNNESKKVELDFPDFPKRKSMNYTHTFSKPVEIGGKTYKTMTFYFDDLTGRDIEAIEAEMMDQNRIILTPETSIMFQSILAAKAAGVPSDEIANLPVGDYMKIRNKARDFLTLSGS